MVKFFQQNIHSLFFFFFNFFISGVEVKFKNCLYPVLILPNQISDLTEVKKTELGLKIGAATTLSSMESTMRQMIAELPGIQLYSEKCIQLIYNSIYNCVIAMMN